MRSRGFSGGFKRCLPSLFHTNAMLAGSTRSALSSHPHASAFALKWPFIAWYAPDHAPDHVCLEDGSPKKKPQNPKRQGMYENSPQMWPRLGNIFGSLLTATASCLRIGWKISIPLWPRRTKFCPHLPWVDLIFYFCCKHRGKCEL